MRNRGRLRIAHCSAVQGMLKMAEAVVSSDGMCSSSTNTVTKLSNRTFAMRHGEVSKTITACKPVLSKILVSRSHTFTFAGGCGYALLFQRVAL